MTYVPMLAYEISTKTITSWLVRLLYKNIKNNLRDPFYRIQSFEHVSTLDNVF